MTLDPATLCARTAAGEAEIAVATNGLSLSQRRVLSLLEDPAAFDELADRQRMEPVKLSRDLTRLAELRLIVLQAPSVPSPVVPAIATPVERQPIAVTVAVTAPADFASPDAVVPASAPGPSPSPSPTALGPDASMDPVVIGSGSRRSAAAYAAGGGVALAVGLGIWFAMRTAEPTARVTSATAATFEQAPQPAPISTEPATTPAPIPATAAPHDPVGLPDARRDVRAALLPPPAGAPKVAVNSPDAKPNATTPAGSAEPAPSSVAPPVSPVGIVAPPIAPAPSPTASPATPPPALVPATAPAATAGPVESAAPVVLAAAAPQPSPATKPPVAAALKAIQREQPVFPREAISAGIETGNVKARLHVDAGGNVTAVDILSAQPQRVFDRAVRGALQRWQFEPGTGTRTTDVDVAFQRN